MRRTLISETPKKVGEEAEICGWIHKRRDHGKLVFFDVRDRSGSVQCVVIPDAEEAHKEAKKATGESVVRLRGLIKSRPSSAVNADAPTGGVEIEVKDLEILSSPDGDLLVDVSQEEMNLNLTTLLDHRMLTLRHKKVRAIFEIYARLLASYARFMRSQGFLEIKTPKIMASATEGGANFFKIEYFDRSAYLAQSPQFYKQAGVGVFERVFEVGSVFRAEPSFTTRHVNEFIGFDAEMGFIEDMGDIMDMLEKAMFAMLSSVEKNCAREVRLYDAEVPKYSVIPRMKLTEAWSVLEKEYGKKMAAGTDIDPEGERMIGEYVKKRYDSDFVFLTHYPTAARPFYTMPSRDPQYTESFDLIFRGVEIATGGQRIHRLARLVENMKKYNLSPNDFSHYLDIFRHGIPPHGGWGMGSERIVQKLLGLKSIKEAILFPRDVKRLTP